MQTYWPIVSSFQRTYPNKKIEATKLEKKQVTDSTHFSGFAARAATASQHGASPSFPHEIWTRIFDLVQPKTLQEEFDTYRNLRQVSRSFRMATEDSFLSRRFLITKALLPTEVLQNFESGGLIKTLQSIPKLFSLSEENRYNQDLQAFLEEHFRKPLKEKPISPASELQHLFDQHIHTVGSVNSHELPEALIKWLKTGQSEGHAFGNGVKSGQAQKRSWSRGSCHEGMIC